MALRLPHRSAPRLPNFLVIGAAKAGTTSLHHYLAQHPDVFMSAEKEPNFFAFGGSPTAFRGPDDEPGSGIAPSPRLENAKYAQSVRTLAGYQKLFRHVRGQRAIGESSVIYLYDPSAPDRIRRVLPEVRLVAVLRNPVDRAYSKFLQFRRQGCEPLTDFQAALEAESERLRVGWSPTWAYFGRGLYGEQIARYYARFQAEHIGVFLYDDFQADPLRVIQGIFRFLGVDDGFEPDLSERHLVSVGTVQQSKWKWLNHLLNEPNWLKSVAKQLLINRRWRAGLRRRLLGLGRVSAERRAEPLDPRLREVLAARYREDILQLQGLIGRDLSAWLAPRPSAGQARSAAGPPEVR